VLITKYYSGNQIEKKEMGGEGRVTHMEEREVHTGLWGGDLREGDHLGDRGVDGRIILRWIFKRWDGAWTGLLWLRIGPGGGPL
jgi:hypothetical protein